MKHSVIMASFLGVSQALVAAAVRSEECISTQHVTIQDGYYTTLNFGWSGPHDLVIRPITSTIVYSRCFVKIDAVDRNTKQKTNLFNSGVGVGDVTIYPGVTYEKLHEGVAYKVNFTKCGYDLFFGMGGDTDTVVDVTRDLTRLPGTKCETKAPVESIDYASSLKFRLEGEPEEILVRQGERKVSEGTIVYVESGYSSTQGISLSGTSEIGVSGGFATALQANIQKSLGTGIAESHDTTRSHSETIVLSGKDCAVWKVLEYETRQKAYVTAPKLGMAEEYPFTVIRSQRMDAECKVPREASKPSP